MLSSLRIKNYRCFSDHEIPIGRLTVMVGRNNAGKTTALEALRLISLVTARYESLRYSDPPPWTDLPRHDRGVSPSLRGVQLNRDNIFSRYGDPPASIVASFSNGTSVSLYIGPGLAIHAVLKDEHGEAVSSQVQARRLTIPRVALLPPIGPLAKEEAILREDHVRESEHSARSSLHFRNQIRNHPDRFPSFCDIAERSWSGLRLSPLEVRGEIENRTLELLVQDHDFVAEVSWMGHGVQMWLQTLWFLARNQDADCVVLDEPDVYMHADLQRKLIRMLKKERNKQTIVATHSTEIMAEVDASEILVLDRANSKSSFANSLPSAQRVLDSLGSVHNLSLARLWSARKCILVEGKDMAFLRTFQDALFPASDESFQAVPSYAIGGWTGWPYAVGSRLVLRNAAGESISTYCILDCDFHTEEEIARRLTEAKERDVELHIWRKKEIENYLLVPAAIERLIIAGSKQFRLIPPDAVGNALEEIADAMKVDTFDALATEYHANNRAGGPSEANRRARRRVDSAWATRQGRLDLVSGKAVLSKISAWSQAEFGVSINPRSLAKSLMPHEICEEVQQMVGAIEARRPFLPCR